MSEYWKSTPKYWCKHCSVFVRDTKLERANHEATGKHKGALKRSLRDLHRTHEQGERDAAAAKREVERVTGVVSAAPASNAAAAAPARTAQPVTSSGARQDAGRGSGAVLGEAERRKQVEQLALMGVSVPDEFRPSLALAGEWTVTSTRVVSGDGVGDSAVANGVRGTKREREVKAEDDEDGDGVEGGEEKAVKDLMKRPRRWGRDSKLVEEGEGKEDDLADLLSGPLKAKTETQNVTAKDEEVPAAAPSMTEVADVVKSQPCVKEEPRDTTETSLGVPESTNDTTPAVIFKKRKGKASVQR